MKKFLWAVSLLVILAPAGVAKAVDWGFGVNRDGTTQFGIGSSGSRAGFGAGTGSGSGGGIFSLNNSYGLPSGSILEIIQNFLFWLLAIFGIAGIFGFVISGIMYLIASGDDDMIKRAKTGMTYSIVGIIVGLSGFVALQAINSWLSGSNNF